MSKLYASHVALKEYVPTTTLQKGSPDTHYFFLYGEEADKLAIEKDFLRFATTFKGIKGYGLTKKRLKRVTKGKKVTYVVLDDPDLPKNSNDEGN